MTSEAMGFGEGRFLDATFCSQLGAFLITIVGFFPYTSFGELFCLQWEFCSGKSASEHLSGLQVKKLNCK